MGEEKSLRDIQMRLELWGPPRISWRRNLRSGKEGREKLEHKRKRKGHS